MVILPFNDLMVVKCRLSFFLDLYFIFFFFRNREPPEFSAILEIILRGPINNGSITGSPLVFSKINYFDIASRMSIHKMSLPFSRMYTYIM